MLKYIPHRCAKNNELINCNHNFPKVGNKGFKKKYSAKRRVGRETGNTTLFLGLTGGIVQKAYKNQESLITCEVFQARSLNQFDSYITKHLHFNLFHFVHQCMQDADLGTVLK